MNQLKQILGLPITISNGVRSSSLNRSTGRNGPHREVGTSGEKSTEARVNDDSPELRISERSYARLIADCSRAIEARNLGSRCNADQTGRGMNTGFFAKTPFERLATIPSMMKIKNGPTNAGSNLNTRNISKPSLATVTNVNSAKNADDHEPKEVLEQEDVTRLDKAHGTRCVAKHEGSKSADTRERSPALSKTDVGTKSAPPTAKQSSHLGNKRTVARNVSVTVKALENGTNEIARKVSTGSPGDNAVFLVTVTEESTSNAPPFRHIDLRINGEPPSDTVIRKLEKLDVISVADKIEITIPVSSQYSENESTLTSNSTISLCISSIANDDMSRAEVSEVMRSRSRAVSGRTTTFPVTKINNSARKSRLSGSKVVPWWTTEESFRRSEIAVARSRETATRGAKSPGMTRVARGNEQRSDQRDQTREVGSDARVKPKIAETSNSSQCSKSRRKTPTPVSRIIETEVRKSKSTERNAQHRGSPGETLFAVKNATKVKSSAPNQPKEGTSSLPKEEIVAKTERPIVAPTPAGAAKKIPTTVNTTKKVESAESIIGKADSAGTNDRSSNRRNSEGNLRAKTISQVANKTVDDKSSTEAAHLADTSKPSKSPMSKAASEPRREIPSKAETKATPKSDTLKHKSAAQSQSKSTNRANLRTNRDGKTLNDSAHQLDDLKDPCVSMKPIEKKKDGTLIDYGLTVPTRKNHEGKLPDSRNAVGYKISEKQEPVIVATIKEMIPTRSKEAHGSRAVHGGIVHPAKLKQNGPVKSEQRPMGRIDRKHHPCKSRGEARKSRTNLPKDSKILDKRMKKDKKLVDSCKLTSSHESEEKKLLYSAWLRRTKNKQDPDDSSKGQRGGPR